VISYFIVGEVIVLLQLFMVSRSARLLLTPHLAYGAAAVSVVLWPLVLYLVAVFFLHSLRNWHR
jgi:hypothetical protein